MCPLILRQLYSRFIRGGFVSERGNDPRLVDAELVPAANTANFTVGNVDNWSDRYSGILISVQHGFEYAYARTLPPPCIRRCGCRRCLLFQKTGYCDLLGLFGH